MTINEVQRLEEQVRFIRNTNRHDQWISYAEQLLSVDPTNWLGFLTLGQGLNNTFSRYDELADVCERALRHYPSDPIFYVMYAHVFFALGEKCYMNARDLLLEAIRIDPEFSAAYRDLGEIYLINWEPERALEYLSTAARLEPENAEYRARRSLALLRSGRARDAFEEVHTALRIAPDDYQVLNTVGMVLLFGGELDEAEKLLRRALEQFPTYEYFQRQLTNCLRERDDRASRTAQGKPYTPLVRRQRGRKRFFDESRSDEAPGRKWRSRLS